MPVDETAQAMFGLGRMNPMMIMQTVRELSSILNMFKNHNKDRAIADVKQTYSFSGQHTDIAFVSENGSINANVIEQIQDDQLRENVTKTYSDAVQDGFLNYDDKTKNFTLTEKGNEHINSEDFIRQFEKDQLEKLSEDKAYVEFKGNSSDLNVFRYTDSISLNHLAHNDPVAFKRVQEYFYECKKYDMVTIDSNGTVKPTEKCLRYLEQNRLDDLKIRKLNKDNIQDFIKQMPDGAKEFGKETGKKAVEKGGQEAAKRAAEEAAKKAGQEAAKKAAEKAAAKASAKAATSTASGAASMGIGTAVSAVVDLSSKGANALTKMDTQQHKVTINRN